MSNFIKGFAKIKEDKVCLFTELHVFSKFVDEHGELCGDTALIAGIRMTLFPRLGVAGISTPWPFRYPQPVKMSISIASFPRLSGTGMTSLNPWFPPLNCQMIAYLSSPLL